jgi:uncharacterized protein YqgC (DUF456 family)
MGEDMADQTGGRSRASGQQNEDSSATTGKSDTGTASSSTGQSASQANGSTTNTQNNSTAQTQSGNRQQVDRPSDGEVLVDRFGNGILNDLKGDIVRTGIGTIVNSAIGPSGTSGGIDATGGVDTATDFNSGANAGTINAITSGLSTVAIGLLNGQEIDQIAQSYVISEGAGFLAKEFINVVPGLSDSVASIGSSAAANSMGEVMKSTTVSVTDGISFNPVAIGASIVGSFLLSEMGVIDSKEAAIGSQIGAVVGQCLIPIPIVGALIGQFFGAIIGGFFADDPDPRSAEFINSADTSAGLYGSGTSSVFGTFGFAHTDNFGGDLDGGAVKFAEQIATMDNQLVTALHMTPTQIEQAKENLQNTTFRYDFGLEDTGWHPSQRILTDRYAAVMDAIDPRAGDMLRFSNPDTQGLKEVIQGAAQVAVFVQQVEANKDKLSDAQLENADKRIQEVHDKHVDDFFTMVYNEDPKIGDPSDAYEDYTEPGYQEMSGSRTPDYLKEAQQDWTASEENKAAEFKEERRELQEDFIESADPKVVEAYDQFVKAKSEFNPYDGKGRSSGQRPPEPSAEVKAFAEGLAAIQPPGEAPLFVANPLVEVPVYGGKDSSQIGVEMHSAQAVARDNLMPQSAPSISAYDSKSGFQMPAQEEVSRVPAEYEALSSYSTPISIPPEPEEPPAYGHNYTISDAPPPYNPPPEAAAPIYTAVYDGKNYYSQPIEMDYSAPANELAPVISAQELQDTALIYQQPAAEVHHAPEELNNVVNLPAQEPIIMYDGKGNPIAVGGG